MKRFSCFAICLLGLVICLAASHADAAKVFGVLPFKVSAEKELGYLSEGVQDMLMSRLFHPNETEVVPKEKLKKEVSALKDLTASELVRIGSQLGADYMITGTITVLGNSFSLDTRVIPVKEGQGFSVSSQGKKLDDLIPEVDRCAQEINERLLGKSPPKKEAALREEVEEKQEEEKPWSPHPQFKAFRYGLNQKDYWRSRGFQDEVAGMDIGDVDGDGENEIVVGLVDRVEVFKFKEKRLTKVTEYVAGDKVPIIALDVGDINKNGRAEIFVSRVNKGRVSSMVLEYQGGRLLPLVRDSDYLFRIVELPNFGSALLGQRMLSSTGEVQVDLVKYFFNPSIEKLIWNGNSYVPEGDVSLPRISGLFLYNFCIGDMDLDGSPEVIVIDQEEKLNVFSMAGERLYRTTEPFGSTLNYIRLNPEKESSIARVSLEINDIYLPPRMILLDVDGDGKKELVVAKNTSSSPYTSRYKSYSDGKIVVLSWSGMSLDPVWETRRLTGCISDFQIKDLDKDGNLDLVLAVIQETEVKVMREARSILLGYTLSRQK